MLIRLSVVQVIHLIRVLELASIYLFKLTNERLSVVEKVDAQSIEV